MSSSDSVSCRICRRQFAQYTCPACNLPYCSLTCFRSEAHSQCSESFYKKEIESEIQSEPTKTAQERLKMMELLKRFEDENKAGGAKADDEDDEDEDEDGNDMINRLQGIDINSVSPDALWSILTPEERTKFTRALDDPSSELAQKLLASEELEKEIRKPWWEMDISTDEDDDEQTQNIRRHQPQPMDIPKSMLKARQNSHPLIYNMCAICIAYAYIIRHLGLSLLSSLASNDADYHAAKKLVSKLLPFLTERKSTMLYTGFSSVVTGLWSRFDDEMTSSLFAILLRDAATLMKPMLVAELTDATAASSNPHNKLIRVLSDLSNLLRSETPSEPKRNHMTQKLIFYGAQAMSTPVALMDSMASGMEQKARELE